MPHMGEFHPLVRKLSLITYVLSGNRLRVNEDHTSNATLQTKPANQPPMNSINMRGKSGLNSEFNGKLISVNFLK